MVITDEDYKLLTEAEKTLDWSKLTNFKQRYLYQRYIALPKGLIGQIKDIAALAREKMGIKRTYKEEAEEIFNGR